MRALCLREVNLPDERSGENQAHDCIAENGGDLADGLIERGVAFAHERSPSETTHDDLRLAVEPASGGYDWRGLVPRSLTMYAAWERFVRHGRPAIADGHTSANWRGLLLLAEPSGELG
ncbi:MAG: hypothetical protein OZ929_20395 [Bryobacterales bacterium]|nr:hypothetical protein [Bryobacterales bacterium]